MKKTRSYTFMIVAILFLACLMTNGSGKTYSSFTDRDSKEGVTANMATVDIELQSEQLISSDSASFVIANNSNIDIYLRVGIIFEPVTASGKPAIADISKISVDTSSPGWVAEKKILKDADNTYTKWFLKYGSGEGYAKVNPNDNPAAAFTVNEIPKDCGLMINVVPEAVQADGGNNALKDFGYSGNVNPAW